MSDRQVFIGNLCNISNDILRVYCEKYGSLTELSINRDKENNVYHCFAFVTFQQTRSTSQFMSNRPHFINGEEVFVKRALPRATSSIPERLIVTNRLVLQDLYKFDRYVLQNYFRRFGRIKKIDTEHGIIDYEDYDDVDRVLLARPHYIRDQEISVTKFSPSEQQENSDNHHIRSSYRHRSTANHNHRCSSQNEQPERVIKISAGSMRISGPGKVEKDLSEQVLLDPPRTDTDESDDVEQGEDGEIDTSLSHSRYEHLEEQFQEYKQAKEIEICGLRMDLERTKQQLADLTQEKLDLLLKNQRSFHDQLTLRLFPDRASIETQTLEALSPEQPNKKRKLSLSPAANREYDYYS